MIETLTELLTTDQGKTAITSLTVFLLGTFIVRIFQPKSKVVWAVSSGFTYLMPKVEGGPVADSILVCTTSIWVQNTGRQTAENVEVHFNFKPHHYEIFPTRTFSESIRADNRMTLSTPELSPQEYFAVQLLSAGRELPLVQNVRWKDGVSKEIAMGPAQILSQNIMRLVRTVMLVGVFAIIYGVISGIVWLGS